MALAGPRAAAAQQPDPAFADPEARRLVTGALLQSRVRVEEGSVRAVVGSRVRVGLRLPGQWNWRARTLFHKESLGVSVSTSGGGENGLVLALSRGAPVIGDSLMNRPPLWGSVGFDPEPESPALLGVMGLSLETVAPDMPGAAALGVYEVFDTTFVDPLGVRGPTLYRYATGRELVAGDPPRTLRAVEFRPRDARAADLTGVLWFDAETGAPVRAMIRPRGHWALRGGLRGFLRGVPLLQKDAEGSVDYMTLSYATADDGSYWPDQAHLAGTVALFWGQTLMPVQFDWDLDWDASALLSTEGALPEPIINGWRLSTGNRALTPFIRELDRVVGQQSAPTVAQLAVRTLGSIRFNQVQGVNFTVPFFFPLDARTTVDANLGIATGGFPPTGALGVQRTVYPHRFGVEAYSGLRDTDWMESVNGVFTSVTALVTGYDDGDYYQVSGGRLWLETGDGALTGSVSLFAEDQRQVRKDVTWSLFEPDPTQVSARSLTIDQGVYWGLRTRADLQLGDDPQRGVLVTRVYGQVALGGNSFLSVGTTTDLVGPLPGPFTGGLRVQAGLANGRAPGQARYYLGGYQTIRGYPSAAASGASALILTGEVGTDVPLVRLVAFGQLGWADDLARLFDAQALTTVGGGLSIGDGILRLDVARGLTRGGVWRVYIATSGLL